MTRLSLMADRQERAAVAPAPLAEFDPCANTLWLALLLVRTALTALFALIVIAYALGG